MDFQHLLLSIICRIARLLRPTSTGWFADRQQSRRTSESLEASPSAITAVRWPLPLLPRRYLNKMASNRKESGEGAAVLLLGFVMDMFKEQQQWPEHQSDWLTNRSTAVTVDQVQVDIDATTITDGPELAHLLMPVWAYQSAAAYLIFISVFGLFMNIVVVIVIISDPQVLSNCRILCCWLPVSKRMMMAVYLRLFIASVAVHFVP